MANITYSLGGTSFDAVPEVMNDLSILPVASTATIGRGIVHTVGVGRNTIALAGKFMAPGVKSAIENHQIASGRNGTPVSFSDGSSTRDVLIKSFVTTPLIGRTEGCSFRIELVVV